MHEAIYGGVVSESTFFSDLCTFMMGFYMPDDKFAEYITTKDKKKQKQLFDKYAKSVI